jgi:hypothetical protein
MDELIIGQTYDFRNEFIGALESVEITQVEGPVYNIKEVFKISSGGGSGPDLAKGSATGYETTTLSVDSITIPLEKVKGYRKYWNYDLYVDKDYLSTNPNFDVNDPNGWWWEATYKHPFSNLASSQQKYFRWENDKGKNFKAIDDEGNSQLFIRKAMRTKPSVEFKEVPTYTITEKGRHSKKQAACWAASAKVGRIAQPEFDFGIKEALGGNFLCRGGSIEFDGKYWISTMQYTWCGDNKGWDEDLYEIWEGGSGRLPTGNIPSGKIPSGTMP